MFYSPHSHSNYCSFDSHRSALEQRSLAKRQQERRLAERAAYAKQQAQEELAYRYLLAQREEEEELERQAEWMRMRSLAEEYAAEKTRMAQPEQIPVDFSPFQFFQLGSPVIPESHQDTHSIPIHTASTPIDESTNPTLDSSNDPLHQHYQTHLNRHKQLSTLSKLHQSLIKQKSNFTLPPVLCFQSPSTSSSTSAIEKSTPKLAFSSLNAPFLAYEDFLVGLLSKADEVDSAGDLTIQKSRKELVRQVELELKDLDEKKEISWKKQNREFDSNLVDGDDVDISATPVALEAKEIDSAQDTSFTADPASASTVDNVSELSSISLDSSAAPAGPAIDTLSDSIISISLSSTSESVEVVESEGAQELVELEEKENRVEGTEKEEKDFVLVE